MRVCCSLHAPAVIVGITRCGTLECNLQERWGELRSAARWLGDIPQGLQIRPVFLQSIQWEATPSSNKYVQRYWRSRAPTSSRACLLTPSFRQHMIFPNCFGHCPDHPWGRSTCFKIVSIYSTKSSKSLAIFFPDNHHVNQPSRLPTADGMTALWAPRQPQSGSDAC
jgi:hypothetical protein